MNIMNSELRQDLVSGDWIVISPGRNKRPHQLIKKSEKKIKAPKKGCPFEGLGKDGNEKPILVYGNEKNRENWQAIVIKNKYPALKCGGICTTFVKNGPYKVAEAIGHHELVITRNHDKNFANLPKADARQVFEIFRDRYLMLLNDKCLEYISIFHNWGPKAGASLYHPHYQIVAIPVIPPDIQHSLSGSYEYYKKHKKCVHCVMLDFEKKHKGRIVYENAGAIAFTPYVSKEPFEIRIFPKKHLPYFENTPDADLDYVVDALQVALKKIEKKLKNPDYNFFIHTAPLKNKENFRHYHWHVEVIPKMSIAAGFELGTGIEINVVDPDEAAKFLRK